MNKDRIEISRRLSSNINWGYGDSIADMRMLIDDLENQGATHIYIGIEYDSLDIYAYEVRTENDEEYQKRMLFLEERKENERKRELEQLQRLKEKYESNKF
mgnify:CR=1 FL=1